jgi:recombinational DNA repair protein (RecF pathway)
VGKSAEISDFRSRELAVAGNFFFCEVCNLVCEYGDPLWQEHQAQLRFHRMKRMLLLRCAKCGTVVVDAYAEYSPERNQFWCKNCIGELGYLKFRSTM